jgi:hypothetical protein
LVGNAVALRKFGIASKAKRGKNNQARMGTIPPETIEQIAAANDIVDVVARIFRSNAPGQISRRSAHFIRRKRPRS